MIIFLNFETPAPNKKYVFFYSDAKNRSYFSKKHDFGGFRPSSHGGSIGLAESYSKMGINFSGDE